MNRASNENTTGQESTTFQIMYYNALIRELIKEFTTKKTNKTSRKSCADKHHVLRDEHYFCVHKMT